MHSWKSPNYKNTQDKIKDKIFQVVNISNFFKVDSTQREKDVTRDTRMMAESIPGFRRRRWKNKMELAPVGTGCLLHTTMLPTAKAVKKQKQKKSIGGTGR